jgi:hypothetical protein
LGKVLKTIKPPSHGGGQGFKSPRVHSRRSNRPEVPGLVCSIVGLSLVWVAFWSGLPIVLGAAGSALGQAGRGGRQTKGGGLALGAIVVGLAAIVLNLLILSFDRLTS